MHLCYLLRTNKHPISQLIESFDMIHQAYYRPHLAVFYCWCWWQWWSSRCFCCDSHFSLTQFLSHSSYRIVFVSLLHPCRMASQMRLFQFSHFLSCLQSAVVTISFYFPERKVCFRLVWKIERDGITLQITLFTCRQTV